MGFAEDLLAGIGAKPSPGNVAFINAWVKSEGGPPDNPLNIGPGKHFGNEQGGAKATADLLTKQGGFYGDIVQNLKMDLGCQQVAQRSSSLSDHWCPGGLSGCGVADYKGSIAKNCGAGSGGTGQTSGAAASSSGGGGGKGCFATAPLVGGCILTHSNLKAIKAALAIGGGVAVLSVGAILVVSAGLHETGAGRAAVRSAAALPLVSGLPTRYRTTSYPSRSRMAPRAAPARTGNRNPPGSVAGLSPEMRAQRARFKAREREAERYSPPQRSFDAERSDVDMF